MATRNNRSRTVHNQSTMPDGTPVAQNGMIVVDNEDKPKEQVQPNAVLLIREIDPDGNIALNIQSLGDVKVTEIETILKYAMKAMEKKLYENQ